MSTCSWPARRLRSALFHNNHDGTFTDVTDKAGVGYPCWANGAAVGDYNNDGWPDLLVTCFGGVVLYRNNGDGTFTDVTKQAGLAAIPSGPWARPLETMTATDWQDLFVSHYAAFDLHDLPAFGSMVNCQYHGIKVQCGPAGLKGSPDNLYHNNGNGTFTDVSKQAGVDDPENLLGLTAVWSDFNNDGKPDLFVANDGAQNYLYRNDGNGPLYRCRVTRPESPWTKTARPWPIWGWLSETTCTPGVSRSRSLTSASSICSSSATTAI